MILEYLAVHPLDIVSSTTDQQAAMWIKELDLERDFPADSAKRTFFLVYALHATHWVIAGVFRGMTDPKSNGRIVWCYPKARFAAAEIKKIFERETAGREPRELTQN